ncbi:MAG: FIVAR domain-containing protein [Prevotella sp.]|nr:FIVAR domain-containing protein [Prevotella sp.]
MRQKVFSILALLFGLLPCMSLTAYAASVSYVDGNGTSQTVDATELESTTISWTDGSWYIVPEGGLTISSRIAVSGTVNLILRDGTELTASAGITTTGATLNIYAQSTGTGALTATGANGASKIGGSAGIGGIGVGVSVSGGAGGTVNIYGGTVTATGGNGGLGGGGGAGIGGGGLGWTSNAGSGAGGTVNIYGGTVTATGGTGGNYGGGGAGIGGGGNGYNAGTPADGTVNNIYGGTVSATGGTGGTSGGVGAGIGGGGNGFTSSAGADGTLTLGVRVKLYNGTDNTGTVLDDSDSESRNYSGSRPKNMFAEGTVAAPATKYDLTLATGSDAHGTVAFTVGGAAATQAEKGDEVTVSVTPNDGYSAKDVTVRAYTSWEAASEILTGGGDNPGLVSDITVTKNETDGTWSFTMPEANVWVVVTYTKNLQDAWIQTIADQTYTGSAITPTVTVKDGETTLVLNTDYTVAYSNNVNTGSATVTVTGTGNYSGTATANFTIVADKSALNTAIGEAETYYNSIKDDHAEAAAALKTAIDNAKAMQEKGDATQEEVNNALSALTTAKTTAEDAVLTETKTALNNDITAAETYYNSIKDSNPTAAATLLEAINAAKQVKDNADATQEQVDAAIAALASAKTTAEQTVLTDTKTALNDDITDAEAYYNSIKDSNPAAAATLLDAINAAKTVKDNADATQEQVDAAIAALASAKTTAEQTVLTETKTALNDDITEAEAYYNSISESNPDAAATLLEAINTAKGVQDNADATQSEIESAAQTLTDALNAAKADVALKRITLVIPAKSYMARIDADKRQIETAVAGVSLFSVRNVTDSQVELTAELNVIAAEMPYLIYNDNDTEVEVSIIVSSNEPDNVAYDSDHFKGTLVDKTFTDEDMEEADHYVLSGGSSFVWVKDAGVLSAGKCWIELIPTSAAHARRLSIVHEGETTGISTVKTTADTKDAAVYDLQGRRVMQPTKGLFIVNGKKVVIK